MKKFINKIVNLPKLILTLWVLSWVVIIIMLIMKFCFGQWYPIVVKNEGFIKACNFVDENIIFRYIIGSILYFVNFNLGLLISLGKKRYHKIIWPILANIIAGGIFTIKTFTELNYIGLILEIVVIVIIPIITNLKSQNFNSKLKCVLVPLIYYGLINLWQFTMLLIRATSDFVLNELPILIVLILQIDYYIFTLTTYLEVCHMGMFGLGWFWSKDVTELRALREKELAKENPDKDLIAEIDKAIEKKSNNESK